MCSECRAHEFLTTSRKASEKAKEIMKENFLDDTWQIDLHDSDKDPDFIPKTKRSQKQAKMTRSNFCQGLSPTRPLRVSLQTKATRM